MLTCSTVKRLDMPSDVLSEDGHMKWGMGL